MGSDIKIQPKNTKKFHLLFKTNNKKIPSARINRANELELHLREDNFDDPRKMLEEMSHKRRFKLILIPTSDLDYAMKLIKQAYQYNEQHLSQKDTKLKPRHHKRHEFWKGLLERAKERNTNFQNLSPSYYCWIGKGGGKSGISFNFVILRKNASVEVYLDKGKKDVNKKRFDALYKYKEDVEKDFGDKLNWERLDLKRACRISFTFEDTGLNTKDKWDELQQKMIEKMILLENAFRLYIERLE